MRKVTSIAIMMLFLTAFFFTISYADDVTPEAAYDMVCNSTNVYIVDVRSAAEWIYVGHPGPNLLGEGDCLDGQVVNFSLLVEKHKKGLVPNKKFVKDVNNFFEDTEDIVLITMCRSGFLGNIARNILVGEGYNAHRMLTGFQGFKDEAGYYTLNGWVVEEYPYNYQSDGAYPD